MPNPVQKFFRQPTVRRVKKVASRQFRKVCPERGFYDVGQYHPTAVRDKQMKRIKGYIKAYDAGLLECGPGGKMRSPYKGRRHSLEYIAPGPEQRPYRSYEGYLPSASGRMLPSPPPRRHEDSSMSMSNLSELVSDEECEEGPEDPENVQDVEDEGSTSGRFEDVTRHNRSALRECMHILDGLDTAELERIRKRLRAFQDTRRRLIFDVASMSAVPSPARLGNVPAVQAGPSCAPSCSTPRKS